MDLRDEYFCSMLLRLKSQRILGKLFRKFQIWYSLFVTRLRIFPAKKVYSLGIPAYSKGSHLYFSNKETFSYENNISWIPAFLLEHIITHDTVSCTLKLN